MNKFTCPLVFFFGSITKTLPPGSAMIATKTQYRVDKYTLERVDTYNHTTNTYFWE